MLCAAVLEPEIGFEPTTSRLQDSSGSSMACWPVLSLHVRLGGSSSQCVPVGRSSAWWTDRGNDRDWVLEGELVVRG